MALAVPPFPYPPPVVDRFPDNTQEDPRGPTIFTRDHNVAAFGRDGQPPPSPLGEWIEDTVYGFGPATNDFGIYAFPPDWRRWSGRYVGQAGHENSRGLIAVELRTPEEVTAAAGPGAPSTVFAVTRWAGAGGLPPMDGLSSTDEPLIDYLAMTPVLRILIREDLAEGGAGARWAGRRFFTETLTHELGHAAMLLLADLYGEGYVIGEVCAMFGRPTSQWDDPDIPWGQRVIEAAAEFFKDVTFPNRQYASRAAYRLPRDRLEDFVNLFYTRTSYPYWGASNQTPLWVHEDTFFDNLGTTSFVHNNNFVVLQAISDEYSTSHGQLGGLRWPLEGSIKIKWNWSPSDDPDDYGPTWDSLIFGPPPPGNPVIYCDIKPTLTFISLDSTTFPVFTGTVYGSVQVPLRRDESGAAPPMAGEMEVTGVDIPPEILAAVPPEGCMIVPGAVGGRGPIPKFDLHPSESPGGEGVGLSLVWPWLETAARGVQPTISVPWPYLRGPSLRVGKPRTGVVAVPHRVVGQTTGRQTLVRVAPRPPDTVLEGAQDLGTGGNVAVVSTLGLASAGEVKVVSAAHSITLGYLSTTDTTLEDVSYLSGHVGHYPDGAYIYER